MNQPIHCPKCKGSGELEMLWGVPSGISAFSEKYNDLMKRAVPDYTKYKVLRLEGATSIIECFLCKGSGVVFISPAIVEGAEL